MVAGGSGGTVGRQMRFSFHGSRLWFTTIFAPKVTCVYGSNRFLIRGVAELSRLK